MFNENIGFKLDSKVRANLESIIQYPLHMHSKVIEIICVVDGIIEISDSALTHKLSYGDVYVFNAKDPHKITAISEKNIVLTLQVDLDYYKCFFKNLDLTYFICDSFIQRDKLVEELRYLRFLLAKIYYEYNAQSVDEFAIEALVKNLLEYLTNNFQYYTYSRSKDNRFEIIRREAMKTNDFYFNRIYGIIDYIYANFNTKIKLEHIAKREFLSVYYLSRYIKKACGLSFCELVSIARCEEAERLLGTTNKTIDDIALEIGFANRKHFTMQFKKWFRTTPSQYRTNLSTQYNDQSKMQYQTFDYPFASLILETYLNEV